MVAELPAKGSAELSGATPTASPYANDTFGMKSQQHGVAFRPLGELSRGFHFELVPEKQTAGNGEPGIWFDLQNALNHVAFIVFVGVTADHDGSLPIAKGVLDLDFAAIGPENDVVTLAHEIDRDDVREPVSIYCAKAGQARLTKKGPDLSGEDLRIWHSRLWMVAPNGLKVRARERPGRSRPCGRTARDRRRSLYASLAGKASVHFLAPGGPPSPSCLAARSSVMRRGISIAALFQYAFLPLREE